jgi:hypothetical protein
VKKPNRGLCPMCGLSMRGATVAHVNVAGELTKQTVCGDCAASGVLLLGVSQALATRAILAPYAVHLRKLAKAYGGDRAVGLEQAADVLASGLAFDPLPGRGPSTDRKRRTSPSETEEK